MKIVSILIFSISRKINEEINLMKVHSKCNFILIHKEWAMSKDLLYYNLIIEIKFLKLFLNLVAIIDNELNFQALVEMFDRLIILMRINCMLMEESRIFVYFILNWLVQKREKRLLLHFLVTFHLLQYFIWLTNRFSILDLILSLTNHLNHILWGYVINLL